MENDEIIRQRQANFKQTNAYAMQNGLIIGLWAIVCQACFVAGLTNPLYSNLWFLMLIGIPALNCYLTLKFRKVVGLDINFPFSRGFVHSVFSLMYGAIWAAVAIFIYMQFFDNGYIFDCYAASFSKPETIKMMEETGMMQQIKEATNGMTPLDIVNDMRHIGAGNYAALILYMYILTSPILGVLVGLFTMRRVHYNKLNK